MLLSSPFITPDRSDSLSNFIYSFFQLYLSNLTDTEVNEFIPTCLYKISVTIYDRKCNGEEREARSIPFSVIFENVLHHPGSSANRASGMRWLSVVSTCDQLKNIKHFFNV
jgi:hypothetical protein